jgi:hypothetical protein
MSDELNTVEKVVEEVLTDLMDERIMLERRMSVGVQASSSGGVQASPSISRCTRPSRTMTETRSKHIDDIANAKLIPRILPVYIPPLSGRLTMTVYPETLTTT